MNQGTGAPGIEEGYWQAVLSQGELSCEHPATDQPELWEGFKYDLKEGVAEQDALDAQMAADLDDCWSQAQTCLDLGKVLELEVSGYNRGGLLVDWEGLQGFVPASHLLGLSPYLDEDGRFAALARRVGTFLKLKVIEIDQQAERFILSERVVTDEEQHRVNLLTEIGPGDVCQGCVTNLCSFGAFVDLGGVEGLIHISELSWGRIDHPRDVLESGQLVDVYVLNVDPKAGRVGLSLKRLLPDPWETVEQRYEPDQLVKGVVTNVVSFGAFARVEEGLEGLIHVSELAEGNFLHPRNVLQEGDEVLARVLSVDGRRRRMALSLRQAGSNEIHEQEAKDAPTAHSIPVPAHRS